MIKISIFLFVLCSCSSIEHFGKVSSITVKQYNKSVFTKLTRVEDRPFEYVKNGEESCFQDDISGDIYTVKHGSLEDAIYLLNITNEKWKFQIPENLDEQSYARKTNHLKATPQQLQITYEYALCEIKFLGFSYSYGYQGTNSYASFRYLTR
jgi:hypothetical protein